MIEVRERGGGVLRGKSPESIARRVYGRRATVHYGGESVRNRHVNGFVQAEVCTPAAAGGYLIEAVWVMDPEVWERAE